MRYLIIAILPLMLLTGYKCTDNNDSETINWVSWNEGYPMALETGKIALIDCYTDWCGWCKVMDQKTFSDAGVIAKVNKDFIAIKFNPEKKDQQYFLGKDTLNGQQLLYALSQGKPSGYPTFYFLVSQTNQMFQEPGYKDVEAFTSLMDRLLQIQKEKTSK